MFDKEQKRKRPLSDLMHASVALKSTTNDNEKRKERHHDRFELADQLFEIEDFQDHFLKVCI